MIYIIVTDNGGSWIKIDLALSFIYKQSAPGYVIAWEITSFTK